MSADTVSPAERSRIMRLVRSENTRPERRVRQELHAAGFRFRLHDRRLAGKPDLVLRRYRTAVFVHGCLWHWHGCRRSRMPSTNVAYWERKIGRTVERDARNAASLAAAGWTVEVVWECQLAESTRRLIDRLSRERSASAQAAADRSAAPPR